ncbi:MAG: carboxylating nicotinate-nucleotide diphosphorylase [Myxococcales bacterium]|nr:carboxylating nicotinate-nucleotide diphosphorylase [Myxococcales bacterium]
MLSPVILDPILRAALDEDLRGGDLTTEACVAPEATARAEAVARQELVVCGGAVFARVFELFDPRCVVEACLADGVVAAAGSVVWRVRGPAQSLLMAERVALNFTQRMSGIATLARRFALAAQGARVTDTRKTTPGLRVLERYAVRTGGAHNHRDNLGAAVMIKDNHIVAAGGIALAVERARARAPHTSRIEVEVKSLAELAEALAARADIVMLDNMDTPTVAEATARCRAVGRPPVGPLVEVSGGITLDRIPELVLAGVDVISIGALTHSAPAADIALDLYDA